MTPFHLRSRMFKPPPPHLQPSFMFTRILLTSSSLPPLFLPPLILLPVASLILPIKASPHRAGPSFPSSLLPFFFADRTFAQGLGSAWSRRGRKELIKLLFVIAFCVCRWVNEKSGKHVHTHTHPRRVARRNLRFFFCRPCSLL